MNNNQEKVNEFTAEIYDVKELRVMLYEIVEDLNSEDYTGTRSLSIAKTKLEEARMWLGKHLSEIGEQTPYVLGNNPETAAMETTADTKYSDEPKKQLDTKVGNQQEEKTFVTMPGFEDELTKKLLEAFLRMQRR